MRRLPARLPIVRKMPLPAILPVDSKAQCIPRLGRSRSKARLDAVAPQRVGEQGVRRAIELGWGHDATALIRERQKRVGERRLT